LITLIDLNSRWGYSLVIPSL